MKTEFSFILLPLNKDIAALEGHCFTMCLHINDFSRSKQTVFAYRAMFVNIICKLHNQNWVDVLLYPRCTTNVLIITM